MEFWGLGLLLALWRYFREVDWDLRVRRKPRQKKARTMSGPPGVGRQ